MTDKADLPDIRSLDETSIGMARALLARGACVGVPTETVYGLAADACDGEAVAKIFAAKGRPSFNPLICHVASIAMAETIAVIGPFERRLMQVFWPGALTIVCPLKAGHAVHPLATAGLDTVALRCPRGPLRDLASDLGRPLAAPSANRSGGVSPTTAAHVAESLAGRIELVLDGGSTAIGVESTIVRVVDERIILLRPGGASRETLTALTGLPVVSFQSGSAITAPGQLTSHYAPAGHIRLDVDHVEPGECLIAFGAEPLPGEETARRVINLSPRADLEEAAANLFAALAALDKPEITRIAVAPIPSEGLGEAINDRLTRAAAPRG